MIISKNIKIYTLNYTISLIIDFLQNSNYYTCIKKGKNMINQFSRTELLIGKDGIEKLNKSKVAIFGIGGVGSFVVEGLTRAGIGKFILVDNDKIETTNLNRQIHATNKTLGKYKVDIMKERILEINPDANIKIFKDFYMPGNNSNILDNTITYVADCIDTITSKIELIMQCKKINIPIISTMGTGNKLDPTKFEITDIYKTSVCPLAKIMRKELKKRDIQNLKVLYSKEEPIRINYPENVEKSPGSISFVPSVAGLIVTGEIIKDILKK